MATNNTKMGWNWQRQRKMQIQYLVLLTDGNMALTSSICKMTSFVIQTRDIHNSPKRAWLNCKCLQVNYLWYTNVDACTFISLYRLPSLKLLLQYKFGGKKQCCKSSCWGQLLKSQLTFQSYHIIQTFSHGTDSESFGHNLDVWDITVILFLIIVYRLYKM